MLFMRKYWKVILVALMLSLLAGWLIWPQGDVARATRLLEKGKYQEAAEILEQVVKDRPAARELKLLQARALIGAGDLARAELVLLNLLREGTEPRLEELLKVFREARAQEIMALLEAGNDVADRVLERVFTHFLGPEFRECIITYAELQASKGEWGLVVRAWQWYLAGGWVPPWDLFQTHLANSLDRHTLSDMQKEFVWEHIDPRHNLAKLTIYSNKRFHFNEIDLEYAQTAVKFLQEDQWKDHPGAHNLALHYKTLEHYLLVAEGHKPLQGLTEEEEEFLLDFTWIYLASELSSLARSMNRDFASTYRGFLKDPKPFLNHFQGATQWILQEHWLQARVQVWRAVASGSIEGSSEAAAYIAGEYTKRGTLTPFLQLPGHADQFSWSGDAGYLAAYLVKEGTWERDLLVLSKEGQQHLFVSDASINWAPGSKDFYVFSNQEYAYYANPAGQPVSVKKDYGHFAGWYNNNTLYTWEGNLIDPATSQVVGKMPEFLAGYHPFCSPAGLLVVTKDDETLLLDASYQVVGVALGGSFRDWSPSGLRILDSYYSYTHRILQAGGEVALALPRSSLIQGWLDEDRLLVKRSLGYPVNWYVYTISTGQVQYFQAPSGNPERLYPAGDGETVAWSREGKIYLGKLKLGN